MCMDMRRTLELQRQLSTRFREHKVDLHLRHSSICTIEPYSQESQTNIAARPHQAGSPLPLVVVILVMALPSQG